MKNLLKSLIINIRNNFTQASNSSHQLQNDLTAQEIFKKRFDLVGKCNSFAGNRYKLHPVKSNIFYIKSAIPTSLHISNRKAIGFRQMMTGIMVIPPRTHAIRTINTNHFDLLNEPLVTEMQSVSQMDSFFSPEVLCSSLENSTLKTEPYRVNITLLHLSFQRMCGFRKLQFFVSFSAVFKITQSSEAHVLAFLFYNCSVLI
jgi:hypothetical protein